MNASDVAAFKLRGAAVIENLHAGTIRIGSTDYPAAVGSPPLEGRMDRGGEELSGGLLVQVRKAVLSTQPARDTKITTLGRRWTVVRSEGTPTEAVWTLYLEADQ